MHCWKKLYGNQHLFVVSIVLVAVLKHFIRYVPIFECQLSKLLRLMCTASLIFGMLSPKFRHLPGALAHPLGRMSPFASTQSVVKLNNFARLLASVARNCAHIYLGGCEVPEQNRKTTSRFAVPLHAPLL